MKKGIVLLIPLLVFATGCIPTIIGAVAYKSSKTRQAKESFIEQFNATNLEREKAGLPPLDLCTEKYNFDKKWADDDPVCAERIAKYEAGDKTALGHPKLEVKETESAQAAPAAPTAQPQVTPGPY